MSAPELVAPEASEEASSMDVTTIALLLTSVALATGGQLLLKAGMNQVGVVDLNIGAVFELLRSIFTTWQLAAGLIAFGSSSVFWLLTLSRLPLSTAYPVVSVSYVLILAFSYLFLDERPSLTVWMGALLVMSGVSLIGIGQR